MPRQLVVNADDYGLTRGVSRGIREAYRQGIVTSTTAMMNLPGVVEHLQRALEDTPGLGLGVHLVLTAGHATLPQGEVPDLVTGEGRFHALTEFSPIRDSAALEQVNAEWRAQIEAFVAATGMAPDHLDSHHHTSYFSEGLFRTQLGLAREYGCAVRCPLNTLDESGLPPDVAAAFSSFAPALIEEFAPATTAVFCAGFYDEGATRESLLSILDRLPSGSTELMCHPGYADAELASASSYVAPREAELAVLSGPAARAAIASRRIQLGNFGDLIREHPA